MAELYLDTFTRVPNTLVEALCRAKLSPNESQVVWCVFRRTFGWNKSSDRISYSQFEDITGITRWHLARVIKKLITRNLLHCNGSGHSLEYSIETNPELWLELRNVTRTGNETLPEQVTSSSITETLPEQVTNVTSIGNEMLPVLVTLPDVLKSLPEQEKSLPEQVTKSLPEQVTTKERKKSTKETILKKENTQKKETSAPHNGFQEYSAKLRSRFADIDFDLELEKFWLYWKDGPRKLKRPKLALLNWMTKASKQKGVRTNDRGPPASRPPPGRATAHQRDTTGVGQWEDIGGEDAD